MRGILSDHNIVGRRESFGRSKHISAMSYVDSLHRGTSRYY